MPEKIVIHRQSHDIDYGPGTEQFTVEVGEVVIVNGRGWRGEECTVVAGVSDREIKVEYAGKVYTVGTACVKGKRKSRRGSHCHCPKNKAAGVTYPEAPPPEWKLSELDPEVRCWLFRFHETFKKWPTDERDFYDPAKNGKLLPGDPRAGKELSKAEFEVYKADFLAFDKSNTGLLEESDIVQLLAQHLHRKPRDSEVANFMGEVDRNHDGKVSLHEYLNRVCGHGYLVSSEEHMCSTSPLPSYDTFVRSPSKLS